MGNYNVGDMIRLSRIANGMTQEELSEGVCSVETLSRIENGKHKVKSDTYRQLMEKMYQITEKNYAVCVSRDMELIEEREYFEDAMAKHDFLKADIYMARMKEIAGEDVSTQRYIRRESAFLDYYLQRMTAEQLVAELEQLAEEVVPWYKQFLDSEVVYPFREQEITLLKRLAVAYGRIDEHPKSKKSVKCCCAACGKDIWQNGRLKSLVLLRIFQSIMGQLASIVSRWNFVNMFCRKQGNMRMHMSYILFCLILSGIK